MIIPASQLAAETLNTILEEFINREGTDYGECELSLQQKVETLRPQVLRGEVLIVYDVKLQSIQLMTRQGYAAMPEQTNP